MKQRNEGKGIDRRQGSKHAKKGCSVHSASLFGAISRLSVRRENSVEITPTFYFFPSLIILSALYFPSCALNARKLGFSLSSFSIIRRLLIFFLEDRVDSPPPSSILNISALYAQIGEKVRRQRDFFFFINRINKGEKNSLCLSNSSSTPSSIHQ